MICFQFCLCPSLAAAFGVWAPQNWVRGQGGFSPSRLRPTSSLALKRAEAWGLWGSGWGEPCPQECLVACLVNLGAAHRRLEAKQKPGCGRCGYGIWEEAATCIATQCCCKMQCFLCSAEVRGIIHATNSYTYGKERYAGMLLTDNSLCMQVHRLSSQNSYSYTLRVTCSHCSKIWKKLKQKQTEYDLCFTTKLKCYKIPAGQKHFATVCEARPDMTVFVHQNQWRTHVGFIIHFNNSLQKLK